MELLTVLGVVALLLTLTMSAMQGSKNRAAIARARAELATIAQALEEYKRLYGDYPQTGDFAQASPGTGQTLSLSHAQSKLFNALTGVFGPRAFTSGDRINGRVVIDVSKLTMEGTRTANFLIPTGTPPQKIEETACFLDPWGNRYLYYYKRAGNPNAWFAPTYVLYSVGPDGYDSVSPAPNTTSLRFPVDGVLTSQFLTNPNNADNLFANAPAQ